MLLLSASKNVCLSLKGVEYKQKSGKIGETVWTQVLSSGIPVISVLKKEPEAGNEMIKQ